MALLNNADEPEMAVPSAATERRRRELQAKIAELVADLPNRFPTDGSVRAGDPGREKDRLKPGLQPVRPRERTG